LKDVLEGVNGIEAIEQIYAWQLNRTSGQKESSFRTLVDEDGQQTG
jgi:hypothetical protein